MSITPWYVSGLHLEDLGSVIGLALGPDGGVYFVVQTMPVMEAQGLELRQLSIGEGRPLTNGSYSLEVARGLLHRLLGQPFEPVAPLDPSSHVYFRESRWVIDGLRLLESAHIIPTPVPAS